MKPKSRWGGAHVKLKQLYLERVPEGMTQKDFGRIYDIGTQGFVAQLLNGERPLNYELAAKFAKALHCTIYDICPEMAASVQHEILPVLGKLRRAAVVVLAALPLSQSPSDANASQGTILHNHFPQYTLTNLRRILVLIQAVLRNTGLWGKLAS